MHKNGSLSYPVQSTIDISASYSNYGLRSVLHGQALRDIRQWLKVALDEGLHKIACLVFRVAIWNVYDKWFDHQSPWSPVNNLWMKGNDWRVVLYKFISQNNQY